MNSMTIKSRRFAFLAACVAVVTSAVAATTGWHGLSQSQRDNRIKMRALAELGHSTGLQCKEWVREVVDDASSGEVIIPATRPNNYQWYNHPYIQSYSQGCPPPGVAPGRIIQMVWHNQSNNNVSPHTAIVYSTTSSGMTWIDCNWQGDGVVRMHYVSYTNFQACVGSEYTLYKIR